MADLTWTPEGEEIFKKLIDAVPEAMRDAIKPKLLEMLAARAVDNPVTADVVTEMVGENAAHMRHAVLAEPIPEIHIERIVIDVEHTSPQALFTGFQP